MEKFYINGFNEFSTNKQVTKLKCSGHISESELLDGVHINNDEHRKILIGKLVREILDRDLFSFYEYKNQTNKTTEITAQINICKTTNEYINLRENVFIVDGNTFTNDELIEAVKNTFPERFI